MKSVDDEVDRLMSLLDVGIAAVRKGDGDVALMAVKAAHDSALRLPQKPGPLKRPANFWRGSTPAVRPDMR